MNIGNIGQLKPKKFLSLGRHDLRHVGDLSKPFFVAIGCSATKGDELNYDDCWVKQLANKLNLEHINLGFTGSSLEYQLDVYQKSRSILNNALFTVWMHPFAYRTHKFKLRNILGDRLCRIKFGNKLDDIDTWHKIQKYVKTVYNDKVIITNCWGYNQKIKLLITFNLVDILEPPTMLKICLFSLSANSKFVISSEKRSPEHAFFENLIAPNVEAAVL